MCRCSCGEERIIITGGLKSGDSRSCGCYHRDQVAKTHTVHGWSSRTKQHPFYDTWCGMNNRCSNPKHDSYPLYGGRGIFVCSRWRHSFENFRQDMEPTWKPGLTLDRIDVNKGYEVGNTRWASNREQALNKRCNHRVTFNGEVRTVTEWAEIVGIHVNTITKRLRKGWPAERALTTPVDKRYSRDMATFSGQPGAANNRARTNSSVGLPRCQAVGQGELFPG